MTGPLCNFVKPLQENMHTERMPCFRRRNPYIQSVYVIAELITKRFRFFPHHNDFIYSLSSNGRRFKEACKVAHKFTRDVIDRKRKEKAEVLCLYSANSSQPLVCIIARTICYVLRFHKSTTSLYKL